MTVGKQLLNKFGKSSSSKQKHERLQADFKRFQENHREKEYQAVQRRMEALLQNS